MPKYDVDRLLDPNQIYTDKKIPVTNWAEKRCQLVHVRFRNYYFDEHAK